MRKNKSAIVSGKTKFIGISDMITGNVIKFDDVQNIITTKPMYFNPEGWKDDPNSYYNTLADSSSQDNNTVTVKLTSEAYNPKVQNKLTISGKTHKVVNIIKHENGIRTMVVKPRISLLEKIVYYWKKFMLFLSNLNR